MAITKVTGEGLDALNDVNLEAYNDTAAITGNAVDIFIYDTSKDSDGGAWRKRTQDTSWYNEASSTTRGSRKDFPAVAVIITDTAADKITIYDGDTPDLDMWMVFNVSGGGMSGSIMCQYATQDKSVAMVNATLMIAQKSSSDNYGSPIINFISEDVVRADPHSGEGGVWLGNISQRNSGMGYVASTRTKLIVNSMINDVAITVLPNAPIDSATGLPTPTILVVTANGESVIKDDGTVVNSANMLALDSCFITDDYRAVFSRQPASGVGFYSGPSLIGVASGWSVVERMQYDSTTSPAIRAGATNPIVVDKNHGSDIGLARISENTTTPSKGSIAYISSKYNTGYMTGDIRGAWNVDTDVTTLGTELVTNTNDRTFAGSTTNWTSSLTVVSGTGKITSSANLTVSSLVAGRSYKISFDVASQVSGNSPRMYMTGTTAGTVATNYAVGTGHSFEFTPSGTSVTSEFYFYGAGTGEYYLDNISVKEAIPDRSVKGNGLAVHGTPTVSAVATGAELKCISGFSSSNYLEQPYNSDLDFGTGDFSVSIWVNVSTNNVAHPLFGHGDDDANNGFLIGADSAGINIGILGVVGSFISESATAPSYPTNAWFQIYYTRVGAVNYVYLNGELKETWVGGLATANFSTKWSYPITTMGKRAGTTNAMPDGSIALPRISATAPTAEQIKEIYEAEKPLFQDNAKCTLNGTSDAVTAMSYDDSNEELLVGTSGGLSVFKGLRRVDENTNNITEVAQQGGLRVEEY